VIIAHDKRSIVKEAVEVARRKMLPKANAIKEMHGGPTVPTLSLVRYGSLWVGPYPSLNPSKLCVHIPHSTAHCNDSGPFSTVHTTWYTPCISQSNYISNLFPFPNFFYLVMMYSQQV